MANLIPIYLIESKNRLGMIKSFRFQPKQSFIFQPGQFAKIIFDKDSLINKDFNKYLSFSSPPGQGYLEFTKKISDSLFSQKLCNLKKGDEVFIQAPLGNCIFQKKYQKIAFLVGGIGITPVMSILGYIAEKKYDTEVILFYSNQSNSGIAFRKELDSLQEKQKNIKVVYMVTDSKSEDESILQGRINSDIVLERLSDIKERIFFIFGPPKMVLAMSQLCKDIGCSKDNIKQEGFIGY